ncbi:hypothetical protein [Aeoliella sp. SH292]|uniref:hypothetical protein n=1 Tax=Aeoliella sp. SH292 TaxID=3454464 RepID=UPI003F9B2718
MTNSENSSFCARELAIGFAGDDSDGEPDYAGNLDRAATFTPLAIPQVVDRAPRESKHKWTWRFGLYGPELPPAMNDIE